MGLILSKTLELVFEGNGNEILLYFESAFSLDNIQIISSTPFVIESEGLNYLLTSDETSQYIEGHEFALLTWKKLTKKDLD